jgi:hypothetical protein
MRSSVFSVEMPSSLMTAQHFGGKYRPYLQGRRVREGRNQQEAGSIYHLILLISYLSYSSTLKI